MWMVCQYCRAWKQHLERKGTFDAKTILILTQEESVISADLEEDELIKGNVTGQ